jgi:hypothetical protein
MKTITDMIIENYRWQLRCPRNLDLRSAALKTAGDALPSKMAAQLVWLATRKHSNVVAFGASSKARK